MLSYSERLMKTEGEDAAVSGVGVGMGEAVGVGVDGTTESEERVGVGEAEGVDSAEEPRLSTQTTWGDESLERSIPIEWIEGESSTVRPRARADSRQEDESPQSERESE